MTVGTISRKSVWTRMYRSAVLPSLTAGGVFHLMRRAQRDRALVLMYHGVHDLRRHGERLTNVNQVDVDAFSRQVRLVKRHYHVVPLETIVRGVRENRPIGGLAAITFDDGYYSVYKNAAPILRELDLSATVFLIAGLVGTNDVTWYDKVEAHVLNTSHRQLTLLGETYRLEDGREEGLQVLKRRLKSVDLRTRDRLVDEIVDKTGALSDELLTPYRLMDWPDILELDAQGFSFGVHTFSHPILSKVDKRDLDREINGAAEMIAERLSTRIDRLIFCYPDGDYTEDVRDHVAASGMAGAVAVESALISRNADPYALPRVAVSREYSDAMFCDATVGFTRWLKRQLHS